jgi:hypothetical protein
MADPTPYTREYSFTGYQSTNPGDPLPAIQLDAELDNIAIALGSLVAAVKDVRRSDGRLRNAIVTLDALGFSFLQVQVLSDAAVASILARGLPPPGSVRMGQFRRALEASGAGRISQINAIVSPDPDDPVNIAWTSDVVSPTGTIATLVKQTLALSDADLADIFLSALTQPN